MGDQNNELALTKLEVARRQIETAIDLYFRSEDPVSIHTLTTAAYQVLDDVALARGTPRMNLLRTIEEVFPPEVVSSVLPIVRKAQNFFKHAARDTDDVHTFRPVQTEFLLLDACVTYPEMAGQSPRMMTAFTIWFFLQHDLPYKFTPEMKEAFDRFKVAYHETDREEFFRDSMEVLGLNR